MGVFATRRGQPPEVERTCTVPVGRRLFFPLVSATFFITEPEKTSVTVRCFSALAPGLSPLTPDAQLRREGLITYLRAARVMKLLMEGLFTSVYAPGKSL